jgi:uncharacterized protein YbjQ (UPF0145 family)
VSPIAFYGAAHPDWCTSGCAYKRFTSGSPATGVTRDTSSRPRHTKPKEDTEIVSTTTAVDGRPVSEYVGVVTGEAVLGANVFRDLFAGLRDILGGRSAGHERSLRQARETALEEMMAEQLGADAVVGVDVDYESIQVGQGGSMLMVSASGTAVKL